MRAYRSDSLVSLTCIPKLHRCLPAAGGMNVVAVAESTPAVLDSFTSKLPLRGVRPDWRR